MKTLLVRLKEIWSRLSWLDLVCLAIVSAGLLFGLLGMGGGLFSFVEYLAVLAGLYLFFRFVGWWRNKLLWSLRNRLIVAYLFIAVVPVVSLVILVVLAGRILYSQLGAYLLYEDLHQRVAMIDDIGAHIAVAHESLPGAITEEESERILAAQSIVHDRDLPGLKIVFSKDLSLLQKVAQGKRSFAGLLQEGESLSLVSLRTVPELKGQRIVVLRVPVTSEFLSTVAPDLGVIQLNLMEQYAGVASQGVLYRSGEKQYRVAKPIVASN